MNSDRINELRKEWEAEEKIAHIHGWDFSHIHDRYEEEDDLPWDYKKIIEEYLDPDMKLMDFDTGGGEFLLSLGHPYKNTAATEGFPPNVELCKETLLPLGIDFKPCDNESDIPFADSSFDIMINRHGSFDPKEIHRLLKDDGIFITQQVGGKNDRDLVEMVLPGTPEPFPELYLSIRKKKFEDAFRGLYEAFMDPSVFLQAVLGIMAVIAGFILKLERTEWLMVILCIGLVITAEILNTCIEKLCDLYSTAYSERIRKIKDMSSGAVLFAALIALTAAVMILLNHI